MKVAIRIPIEYFDINKGIQVKWLCLRTITFLRCHNVSKKSVGLAEANTNSILAEWKAKRQTIYSLKFKIGVASL